MARAYSLDLRERVVAACRSRNLERCASAACALPLKRDALLHLIDDSGTCHSNSLSIANPDVLSDRAHFLRGRNARGPRHSRPIDSRA
jgi:hypothetical protein